MAAICRVVLLHHHHLFICQGIMNTPLWIFFDLYAATALYPYHLSPFGVVNFNQMLTSLLYIHHSGADCGWCHDDGKYSYQAVLLERTLFGNIFALHHCGMMSTWKDVLGKYRVTVCVLVTGAPARGRGPLAKRWPKGMHCDIKRSSVNSSVNTLLHIKHSRNLNSFP